ncbi:MAG: galactose-1-phosphate uridylyltransferase [Sulfurospirillaceae bacterium]|nr:galactose-1-phosphate uridylyltransferase [Sulfurospirillaceae bacterium]
MSEIRFDLLRNQYILIAPERLHRPDFYQCKNKPDTNNTTCPFCYGNEYLTPPEIFALRDNEANTAGWQTRVVPNLFKAVQIELEDRSRRKGLFESIPGVGAHEVLIDSPEHKNDLDDLEEYKIENWLKSIIRRIVDLRNDMRLVHLSVFKNHGSNSGATQEHPHTQLLALPIMPKNELDFLKQNLEYYRKHGRGKLQDIVENERFFKDNRVIGEIGDFVAFCPFASSFPFEVMIAPTKNIGNLDECDHDDVKNLSLIIKHVFFKLKKQLGEFDYNLYFKLSPLNSNFQNEEYLPYIHKSFRFSLSIIPRIYKLGGFELSTNMAINPMSPEECANLLNSEEIV